MLFTISIKICFYLLFWPAEKQTHLKFQWNFTLEKGEFILKTSFLLHLMRYISHQWFILTTRNLSFMIYFYIVPRSFFSLSSWGWNTLPGACSDLDLYSSIAKATIPYCKWIHGTSNRQLLVSHLYLQLCVSFLWKVYIHTFHRSNCQSEIFFIVHANWTIR